MVRRLDERIHNIKELLKILQEKLNSSEEDKSEEGRFIVDGEQINPFCIEIMVDLTGKMIERMMDELGGTTYCARIKTKQILIFWRHLEYLMEGIETSQHATTELLTNLSRDNEEWDELQKITVLHYDKSFSETTTLLD